MRTCHLVVLLITAVGCAGSAKTWSQDKLLERASFDLQCDKGSLETRELDTGVSGVRGCGKQATYVWDGATSRWIMNTASGGPEPVEASGGPEPVEATNAP